MEHTLGLSKYDGIRNMLNIDYKGNVPSKAASYILIHQTFCMHCGCLELMKNVLFGKKATTSMLINPQLQKSPPSLIHKYRASSTHVRTFRRKKNCWMFYQIVGYFIKRSMKTLVQKFHSEVPCDG